MKFVVYNTGWGNRRTHLLGELRPRRPKKFDAVSTIFGFLHRVGSHSGPVMERRWKEAETKMLKRYSVYIPHLKTKNERL